MGTGSAPKSLIPTVQPQTQVLAHLCRLMGIWTPSKSCLTQCSEPKRFNFSITHWPLRLPKHVGHEHRSMWHPAKWQLCFLMGTYRDMWQWLPSHRTRRRELGKRSWGNEINEITLLKPLVTKLIASSWLIPSTQTTSFSPMGSERKALNLGDMWSIFCNSSGRKGLRSIWLLTVWMGIRELPQHTRGMGGTNDRFHFTFQSYWGLLDARCHAQSWRPLHIHFHIHFLVWMD